MTKMTCTLGPASAEQEIVQNLADAGMSVARLNFSHVKRGNYEFPIKEIGLVNGSVSERSERPLGRRAS